MVCEDRLDQHRMNADRALQAIGWQKAGVHTLFCIYTTEQPHRHIIAVRQLHNQHIGFAIAFVYRSRITTSARLPGSKCASSDGLLARAAYRSLSKDMNLSKSKARLKSPTLHQRNLNPNCVSLAGKALLIVPNAPDPENWLGA
jgi:hypothetical protein